MAIYYYTIIIHCKYIFNLFILLLYETDHPGPNRGLWRESDTVMLTVTFVLITALIAYLIFTARILGLVLREDESLDERDLAILRGSYTGDHSQSPVTPPFF